MLTVRNLNQRASHLTAFAKSHAESLRIGFQELDEVQVLDFGVKSEGGLEAGKLLAKICFLEWRRWRSHLPIRNSPKSRRFSFARITQLLHA